MYKRLSPLLALCAAITAQQAGITPDKLADAGSEVDQPTIAALPDGSIAAAWVSNRERTGRLLLRTRANNAWSAPEDATNPERTDDPNSPRHPYQHAKMLCILPQGARPSVRKACENIGIQ